MRPTTTNDDCRISYGGGLGMSPCIMGLTTQDPYTLIQLSRQRLSHKSVKAYATMPIGIMGKKSLALLD